MNPELVLALILVHLHYLESTWLTLVCMNLVDRKGIFELKWEGFNLVREVNIELHVPRLDKVVDPVFEVSS